MAFTPWSESRSQGADIEKTRYTAGFPNFARLVTPTMTRSFPLFSLLNILAGSFAAAAEPGELFPTDSRHWSQVDQAVVLTDFSAVDPASALVTGRRKKGKWKLIPWESAEHQGTALSIYTSTTPPPVEMLLKARGWHAVYIGLATISGGFDIGYGAIRARLSDEPVFKRMACNLELLPNRRSVIQEQFLTVAELGGQSLVIAPFPGRAANVCYVKLVPLTDGEVRSWSARRSQPRQRTSLATFDGHSWIWPYRPRSEAELLENFRGFEDSDIGKWWFQVAGADLVCYPSQVGNIPGDGTTDFIGGAYAEYTRSLEALFKQGINPLKVARQAARDQGAEFHVMLRPAGWKGSMPYEETFNSKFYEAHPEWRCIDRDGTPTFYMSYAFPEVRRHLLDIYRETLALKPDGVGLLFNRGMPMILWEEPFCARFREKYQADAREVPEDDPRILALRAEIMTEFLTEIRALLDETAKSQGRRERYTISLGTFAKEADNQKFGIDLPRWIERGLVDELAVAWFAYHTSFVQPDMEYYRRLTAASQVKVYPMVIAWKTGKPQELCRKVADYYAGGAPGVAIWDPQVEKGWVDKSPGNSFDVLSRLGDPDTVARWAQQGPPQPLTVPLTRLDDNHFSRWFPNTGF